MDTDENPETANEWRISSVPTIILFSGGREKQRFMGHANNVVKDAIRSALTIGDMPVPHHPESQSLCRYLIETAVEFVPVLEEVLWATKKSVDDPVDGMKRLKVDFWVLGLWLANADGDISESESALLRDVEELFDPNGKKHGVTNLQLRDINRDSVRVHRAVWSELRLPSSVLYLQVSDDEHGTGYANKARAMFFRFANALVKADGKVTAKEEQILFKLKDVLYPPADNIAVSFDNCHGDS